MAEIRLQPPEPFNFRTPDDWPRWKRRFQQFRDASGLTESSSGKQVSTLLYCLGEEAEEILVSTNATADDRKDYARVLGKFDGYFQVRKNVIYERARFNKRDQQAGESAEQYIMALYSLAENCDYGEMTEEMIRDRLVIGIRDVRLSQKMQLDSKLTLETAKKTICQSEAVHEQQRELHGEAQTWTLSTLNARRSPATVSTAAADDDLRLHSAAGAVEDNILAKCAPQKTPNVTSASAKPRPMTRCAK